MRQLVLYSATFVLLLTSASQGFSAVTAVTTFSASNNRQLTFHVYTPPGYSATASQDYPTVYSLHGIGGTSLQRANTYAPTLDQRISQGAVAPMIWVFPDGQTDSFYGDSFDGQIRVHSHIIGEIIPYVDAHFRTVPYREGRAVEGFSMGGFGAAMYAAKHPELFSAVLEYGGALSNWERLQRFDAEVAAEMYNNVEANFTPYSVYDQTAASAEALRELVNYKMIVGDADPQMGSNLLFRDHVASLGIDPKFQIVPGVGHVGGQYLTQGAGLTFLNQHFAALYAFTGDFTKDGVTDGADLLTWQRRLGNTGGDDADGNDDGSVDGLDLLLWRGEVGKISTAATTTPEPSALAHLQGLLAMALITVRRKRL